MNLRDLLASATFWTAVGALAAIAAVFAPFLTGKRWGDRLLQRLLARERAFYAEASSQRSNPRPTPETDLTQQYFSAVDLGVSGVKSLPDAAKRPVRDQLRALIQELRVTHESLFTVLQLFSEDDAGRFFGEFSDSKRTFDKVYVRGNIAHEARTHCHDIEMAVDGLMSAIPAGTPGADALLSLRYSVVVQDQDVIVPVMLAILERTRMEMELIALSIRRNEKRRAIRLKEKYWFDVAPLHLQLRDTLDSMDRVTRGL